MRRRSFINIMLLIGLLACLQLPASSLAADPPTFDSPTAVISAAEDAFVSRDFKAFAYCFDPAGQKLMNTNSLAILAVYVSLSTDTDAGKAAKTLLNKYGLTDLSKQAGESDDHLYARLAGQIKDQRGFMAESMPLVNTDTYHAKFPKGTLAGVKIDGAKAKGSYVVHVSEKNTMRQDMTFAKIGGSWKISHEMFFPAPVEVNQ